MNKQTSDVQKIINKVVDDLVKENKEQLSLAHADSVLHGVGYMKTGPDRGLEYIPFENVVIKDESKTARQLRVWADEADKEGYAHTDEIREAADLIDAYRMNNRQQMKIIAELREQNK